MGHRSFGLERNEKLRGVVRELMAQQFSGNLTATAKALGMSPAAMHDFLGGTRGAGMKLLDGLQRHTGKTIDELVSGEFKTTGGGGALVRWGDIPAWQTHSVEARRIFHNRLPPLAFDLADDLRGMKPPTVIDPATVYGYARACWDGLSDDEQADALDAQAEAEMDSEDARAEELLKRGELRDEVALHRAGRAPEPAGASPSTRARPAPAAKSARGRKPKA